MKDRGQLAATYHSAQHEPQPPNHNRISSPTRTRAQRTLDKRPATGEWQHHTVKLLEEARQTKQSCMVLRDRDTTDKKTGDRDVRDHLNAVNEELRKKVQVTAKLKAKLEKQASQTAAELSSVIQARARVKEKLDERAKPLKVALARKEQRQARPETEQINDKAERALQQETLELQSSVDHLQELARAAAELIVKLETSHANLQADLRDKTESLRLDRACLEVVPSMSTADTQMAPKSASQLPEKWKKCTMQLLYDAAGLEQQSMRLRKVLSKTVSSLTTSHLQAFGAVNEALKSKVKQTKVLQNQLQKNLDAVNTELVELQYHREHIAGTLDAKRGPLSVVRQRLELRQQRPNREAVRDSVEEALETEYTKLKKAMATLQAKLEKIDVERGRLHQLKLQLESDLSNKNSALKHDKKALAIDLSQVRLPSGTASLDACSARSYSTLPSIRSLGGGPSRSAR
ncbi:Tektin [Diplonema papillatum]|nr:Tektin [Diplonema papillatum]